MSTHPVMCQQRSRPDAKRAARSQGHTQCTAKGYVHTHITLPEVTFTYTKQQPYRLKVVKTHGPTKVDHVTHFMIAMVTFVFQPY